MPNKTITYSSEMMTNFKQAEVMSPERNFQALQTDEGHSLFFSVGTDDVFYLTQETPGHVTGWQKTDLSSTLKADYGGAAIVAKNFAVATNRATQKVDMALVITSAGNDNLYLSLGNATSDSAWAGHLNWVRFAFDDPVHPLATVSVANVFISEASDGEYIVVDVLRDPSSAEPVIFRYYIEPRKTTGHAWNPHDVSADIDASQVTSCLGRRKHDRVEGLYTLGSIAGETQLIYQTLYNPFNRKLPSEPVRLQLPAGSQPSALASVAVNENFTDLYVACEKALYCFPYDQQKDEAQGVKVLDNALFEMVTSLFAFATATRIIVWGLNRAQQIFYTSCDRTQIQNPASWSHPLPIAGNVEQVAPYVNRADDGNTFFVHTGAGELQKSVQTPATMLWKSDNILLPPLDKKAKAADFHSYTTRLHVTDDNKKPLANVDVNLGAVHRAAVYINNRYYVLDPTPITVKTDATGGVTIVERIANLQGTCLQVHGDDGSIISINPMDKSFQKVAALNSKDSLGSATIKNPDGTTQPLIDPGTGDDDKQNVVDTIGNLKTVYQSLPTDGTVKPVTNRSAMSLSAVPRAHIMTFAHPNAMMALSFDPVSDLSNAIDVAAGDLYSYLKSGADYVIHIVKDAAEDAYHFVAEIAGQMYHFVLDAAAKVLGALEFVFNAIKTFVEFLIKFLLFLFDWDDFLRTKDVYKKLLKLYFNHVIEGLPTLKADFKSVITGAKNSVDDWAGVKRDDWKSGVDGSGNSLGGFSVTGDIEKYFSAPAMSFFQHFLDNVMNSEGSDGVGSEDQALDRVLETLTDESNVLVGAANRIQSEILDGSTYQSLSLEDLLKRLTAIVVDAVLNMSEGIMDSAIDLLATLTKQIWDEVDKDVWIPVLSDILKFFHINLSFSMLDVILMVGAIPSTIVYKVLHDKAPFSQDDGFCHPLFASDTLDALKAALSVPVPQVKRRMMASLAVDDDASTEPASTDPPDKKNSTSAVGIHLSDSTQSQVFQEGHMLGGILALLTGALIVSDATADSGKKEFEEAAGIAMIAAGAASGLTAVFATPLPIDDNEVSEVASACTGLTLLFKLYFKFKSFADEAQAKKVGAGIDALLATIAIAPACYHFFELSHDPVSKERTLAFMDETGNLCNYLQRIAAFGVAMTEGTPKAVFSAAMGVLVLSWGAMQITEASAESA
ncbi:MAG TPA: hypothetical protein VMS31_21975 [Pyrinomonadaceae bacterium]|nr:hypothetical protein [Pyrinomonadaceae bacterium]